MVSLTDFFDLPKKSQIIQNENYLLPIGTSFFAGKGCHCYHKGDQNIR
jgi:hypothetical protein